jgi:hypothetical protein
MRNYHIDLKLASIVPIASLDFTSRKSIAIPAGVVGKS